MEFGMAAVGTATGLCVHPAAVRPLSSSSVGTKLCSRTVTTTLSCREEICNVKRKIVGRKLQCLGPILVARGYSDGDKHPVQSGQIQESQANSSSLQRREVIGNAISLLMCTVSFPASAAEDEFTVYEDTAQKFSLLVPPEWTKGEGNAGVRKVTAFYPESDTSANVNVIITNIGADYTSLSSFGTVDVFAENLVNSLDRSWKKPKGQEAKLVDSHAKNGMYYIEYTIQMPGEEKRHLISVVGMASDGWIMRLYTVTGQYLEEDGAKYKESLQKAISSFRFI